MDNKFLVQTTYMHEYIDKKIYKVKYTKEIILTRKSRNYSISLKVITVTDLQFNVLSFMKRLNFATHSRYLGTTVKLFQDNVAL